jgi:hypothetical protein
MQKILSLLKSLKPNIRFLIAVVIFIITTIGLLYLDSKYRIRYIKLQGTSGKIELKGISAFQNENLFLLSEKDTQEQIILNNPYIKTVGIAKEYPDTLTLNITLNKPRAYLQVKDGFYLLTDNAYILEKNREVKSPKLPVITYYQNVPFSINQAGQQLLAKDIQDSLFFLSKLQSMRIPIISIDIEGFHMLGLYTENQKFFFSSEKDIKRQEYQLAAAVSEFNVNGKKFQSLDLRFDKPVVVF